MLRELFPPEPWRLEEWISGTELGKETEVAVGRQELFSAVCEAQSRDARIVDHGSKDAGTSDKALQHPNELFGFRQKREGR